MKNERKASQKGAIAVFTMIAMVFFLITIMSVYMISSKRAQTQTESMGMIQEQYYAEEGEENKKYAAKIATDDEMIPIYTKEQLWSVGNNVGVEIEGKVYDFSQTDLTKYELKNDIVINISELEATQIINEPNITKNNYEIYYYYEGDYYEAALDGTSDLSINGMNFKYKNLSKSLGYVTDGLMLHYDGIKNTALGHDNFVTTWKDLSGNGNDGTLNGCTWEKTGLSFNGIDDWVGIGEMNYPNITLQVVVENREIGGGSKCYIGNWETGGYGLSLISNGQNRINVYIDSAYYDQTDTGSNATEENVKYSVSGLYDGNVLKLFLNEVKFEKNIKGTIGYPLKQTILALGTNPNGSSATTGYLNGKIYSARVYNRALTDEEVQKNYEIDKGRFGIE